MVLDSFIEKLKDNSDIEKILSSYVNLKRKGRGLTGLCPFHSEKTPSFTVYPDTQSYYCFGCGAGGDVITFICQIEHLEYIETLKFLAEKAGLQLPDYSVDDKTAQQKVRTFELNRESARFFRTCLKSDKGKDARHYLLNRGLEPKTITKFGLGYAPESWDNLRDHLQSKGFSQAEMLTAAVVNSGRNNGSYDAFRNRIIFPIIDLRGNVIGFGGRNLGDQGPKYLNSADTPVFKKSRNLYALGFAKEAKSDTLLLAEGYMDVIALHQAGFPNTVATLGTALTESQARLVGQYAKNVVIAYDSDEAGQKATKRAIIMFSNTDVSVRVLEMTGAKDPDEYIKKFGAIRFRTLVDTGKSAIHFEIDKLKAIHDLNNTEGKLAFLNKFCQLMAEIPGELQRDVYIGEIAREFDVGKERLLLTTKSINKKKQQAKQRTDSQNLRAYPQGQTGTRPRAITDDLLGATVASEKLITILMQNPDYFDEIQSKMDAEDFSDQELQSIFQTLANRLREGLSIQIIHLSGNLSPQQMSRLSKLLASSRGIQFSRDQVEEYIQAVKKHKEHKSSEEVANMGLEEYQRYITSLAAKKK